jgi:glutamyl-tRNA synthetase
MKVFGLLKNNHPHYWFSHLPSITNMKANKARSNKRAANFALGPQNAVDGQAVARFPPEPSAYLYIGHFKAATLNQYFSQMYDGRLIIFFNKINPSKERVDWGNTIRSKEVDESGAYFTNYGS